MHLLLHQTYCNLIMRLKSNKANIFLNICILVATIIYSKYLDRMRQWRTGLVKKVKFFRIFSLSVHLNVLEPIRNPPVVQQWNVGAMLLQWRKPFKKKGQTKAVSFARAVNPFRTNAAFSNGSMKVSAIRREQTYKSACLCSFRLAILIFIDW